MGNFQRNVGSYEESISSAFGQLASSMGPVAKSTGQFGKVIGGLDGPIQVAVGAVGGLGKAFKALKAAIVANPVGLIITALVAAGVAMSNLIRKTKSLSQEEQILKIKADATARALEEQQNANQVLGNKVGDLLGTYRKLQIQWNSLKNDAERTRWIANQREEINKLGGKVNNLTDAWIFFVKNSPQVVEALKAIAEAEAYGDLYKEAIKNEGFLLYVAKVISEVRQYMKEPSQVYNDKSVTTWCDKEPNLILLNDYVSNFKFNLKSKTFNPTEISFGKYDSINSWQGIKDEINSFDSETISSISISFIFIMSYKSIVCIIISTK